MLRRQNLAFKNLLIFYLKIYFQKSYIDVIHTNSLHGHLTDTPSGFFGYPDPIGHADYFPNGGSNQPGCTILQIGCSHGRAHQYFTESISGTNKFESANCYHQDYYKYLPDRCLSNSIGEGRMGYYSNSNGDIGLFYLTTNSNSPFSRS
jgi:pancreatic triacylglycerol lipase